MRRAQQIEFTSQWNKIKKTKIVSRYHRSPVAKFLTLIFGWACINYFFLLRRGFLGRKARQWQLRNPMNDLRRRHYLVANINLIEELPQKQEKSWFSPVKFNCFSDVKNGNNLSFFSAPLTVITVFDIAKAIKFYWWKSWFFFFLWTFFY